MRAEQEQEQERKGKQSEEKEEEGLQGQMRELSQCVASAVLYCSFSSSADDGKP